MSEHEPDDAIEPDPLDAELAAAGAALRGGSAPASGDRIITDVLHRDVARARRRSRLVTGCAAVLVVAVLGATMLTRTHGGTQTANRGDSAEAIVAALPPQPLDPTHVKLVASVSRFDSCDALLDRLHRVGAAHVGSRGFGTTFGVFGNMPGFGLNALGAEDAKGAAPTPQNLGTATSGFAASGGETLGTNVIVAGVDEPDTVKATDSIIVELHNNELRIVDTAAQAIVGTLDLGDPKKGDDVSSYPSTLLLDGRRALVFGHEIVTAKPLPGDPSQSRPTVDYTTLTFVDLADAAKPTITDRVRIEGDLVAVRRVGGQVRMVTSSSLQDLPIVVPTTPNAVAPALQQNRLAVAGSSSGDWIPDWDHGQGTPASPLMGCNDVVVPDTFAGVQMTSLVQFDVDGPFAPSATALLAPAEDLTATASDVVIASHVWVDPIDQGKDFTDWKTAVHHFRFTEAGAPEYLASGAVSGSIRDDFSLSVLDSGAVGVVTADVLPWKQRNDAKVTVRVLRSDDATHTMNQVGSLVPSKSGHDVAGLRFLGNRLLVASGSGGNLVSVVDLSNPAVPVDKGSVSLPGTGAYFQPVDDNRVLVLGDLPPKDGQFQTGIHATMLDLSGPPKVTGSLAQDWIYTDANSDHHAFIWWPSRSIAAFGIGHIYVPGVTPPWQTPQGEFVTVGAGAPTAVAVTPHEADLGPRCPTTGLYDPTKCDNTGPPQVERVLVVKGVPWLYTSESLERLDPQSLAPSGIVVLRP